MSHRLASPGPHPGARPGVGARRRAPGGRVFACGTRPGTARKNDVGPLSRRPTTRKKEHKGPVPCVLGSGHGRGPQQPKPWTKNLAFGTWNVTSLGGKEPELVREVERYRLEIVGLASTHSLGSGTQLLERGWTLFFSGVPHGERRQAGVGLLITSKSEAMVLNRKKVACTLQVGGEVLPQVEEFKYLGVLFTSEGRMDREIDRWIGAAATVMRSMYRSVVVKKELSRKAKFSIYQSIYVPTLTYGHELWVMNERVRSRIQVAEMSFLHRVAGRPPRDRVRSSVTQEELGVELLLLHIERGQLRWLGHLFRMPPGRLPGEVFQACPTGKRPRGRPRTRWRDYVSWLAWERLGVPPEELEEVAREREHSCMEALKAPSHKSATCYMMFVHKKFLMSVSFEVVGLRRCARRPLLIRGMGPRFMKYTLATGYNPKKFVQGVSKYLAGSWGQQSKQRCPDFPFPRHFLQLFRRDPKAFPGQPRDIVSPVCPWSSPGSLPSGACPEHLPRETSRRHPKQMPKPPQLSPFDVEEQRLYSELLPGDRAPYPISKGLPRHPAEEAHSGCLYLGSYPFGHDPELMTTGESRNVD
ncbi:hypothetical protein QTP70_007204 [Hemibagrus guttatus]|uniref:Uncharacterized protein n=1 Tax=Hemibagrus guttatus TaxID=175788 RepID=A0AAE0V088_9TELE|nr:hypothetical protein QTP70_007204 [Hemibagrus guttatus]